MLKTVYWDFERAENRIAGSKAKNLLKTDQFGILVADGFILPVSFGEEFVRQREYIRNRLSILAGMRKSIVEDIRKRDFTPSQFKTLRYIYEELGEGFIVRTSSDSEDREDTSSAGMFYSSERIDSWDSFTKAIRECYASLYCDRHMEFLAENGYVAGTMTASVIIQKYVSGEFSGIGFSANPVGNQIGEMMLSIGACDCRDVVNGKHPVNVYTMKESNHLLQIYEKNLEINPEIPEAVFRLLGEMRRKFGFEVDMEFTMSNGRIVVFQVRPITTVQWRDDRVFQKVISDDQYRLYNTGTLRPLEVSIQNHAIQCFNHAVEKGLPLMALVNDMEWIGGKLFIKTAFLESEMGKLGQFMEKVDELQKNHQNIYFHEIRPQALENFQKAADLVASLDTQDDQMLYNALHYVMAYKRESALLHNPAEFGWIYIMRDGAGEHNFFREFPELEALSDSQFFALIYHSTFNSDFRMRIFMLAKMVRKNERLQTLFSDIHADYVLYHTLLSELSPQDAFLKEVQKTVDDYMFELVKDWKELFQPCLYIAPHTLLGKVRHVLRADETKWVKGLKDIEQQKIQSYNLITTSFSKERKQNFDQCLRAAECAFQSRDDHAYYLERAPVSCMNVVLDKIANRLMEKELLDCKSDIRYLTLEEIADLLQKGAILDVKQCISSRKKQFLKNQSLALPEKFIPSSFAAATPDRIRGTANMNCTAEGKLVRPSDKMEPDQVYILCLEDDKFEVEDILTLAANVNGLIIEHGNPLSHLSIAARELSLLILYGAPEEEIPSYTWVQLNGETMSITPVSTDNE